LGHEVTNNYGELFACKKALELALKNGELRIFGDSKLVVEYWSKGHVKYEVGEETVNLANEVKKLRKEFEVLGGRIILISGGNNPADLGFHKG
jgi:ribonuclease HI